MKIENIIVEWINNEYELDVISRQQLFLKYLEIWLQDSIVQKNKNFNNKNFYKLCDYLIHEKILIGFNHTTRGYTYFIRKGSKPTSEMAISALYPLGFLSHLTAMNLYGIGNTQTTGIYFTCPARKDWKDLCLKEIKKRFKNFEVTKSISNEYIEINDVILSTQSILDPYPHQSILEEAGSTKTIIITNKKKLVESEWWNQCHLQNVVDLYLDMLRTPHYCGGISHVLGVYRENILKDNDLFQELITSLTKNGSIIDRARFGYIFDKVLLLKTPEIKEWKEEQQGKRGSSRKLFSNFEFDSTFDEEWNLSINHPTIKNLVLNTTT
ncbi:MULTISPECIES: hypothetical protein [Acinetobacter]|jgi:predicted transcriptional regulator of viral defense system|uniref:Uncharacterized protein n=7 Tax=Acinetobacter TaxID=469 RepID=A0A427UJN2_ACIJO|nr:MULTISPECIES: hypothetical protein [Acinetobacter]MBP1510196.1 hypothetical protein [Acinetobacter nosocomialis]MDQ9827205.1 hypothetical protein [Acinetobacter sp. 163]RSE17423.1 hypothetical protein EGT73_17115 [Acinetobacter johnsonii]SSR16926.1 Uncharacterised protein [Acinetobacter nosocomialis]